MRLGRRRYARQKREDHESIDSKLTAKPVDEDGRNRTGERENSRFHDVNATCLDDCGHGAANFKTV